MFASMHNERFWILNDLVNKNWITTGHYNLDYLIKGHKKELHLSSKIPGYKYLKRLYSFIKRE